MTPHDWEHVTNCLGAILDEPEREREILAMEPPETRRHLETLLAAHRGVAQGTGPVSRRVVAERYELLRMLGAGGNGEAWLGVDSASGCEVVLKMPIHWQWYRDDLTRRFLAEAEVLRRLEHPSIVAMLNSGSTSEGAPFFVMPYVEGVTLRERIDRGLIAGEEAAAIVEQVGGGLEAAHRESIVHRDIKPENIMLQETERGIRAILIDFGIAVPCAPGESAGTTTSFFGTTRYMAPEQLLGKPAPASDVYGLALVTYEMLTGRPLFAAESPVALFEAQRGFRESALAGLPYSVRYALLGGLVWSPEKRPAVGEFAAKVAGAIRQWGGHWMPSRRLVLGAAAAGVPLAGWLGYRMRPLSVAERTLSYQAGQTFEELGWSKVGSVDVNVTILDQRSSKVLGNRLASTDQGAYRTDLTERVRRAGLTRPWRMTCCVIPLHGACGIGIGFTELGVGFVMSATVPDQGPSSVTATVAYHPQLTSIEAPARFSTEKMTELRMNFDPGSRTASIAVDGKVMITGYRGRREYVGKGMGVGFSTANSKMGEGIFGDLSFAMD